MRGFLILLAVVLGAIGVGIGAEAAAQPTRYGPPAAGFTAAFPATPTVTSHTKGSVTSFGYMARGPSSSLLVSILVRPASSWSGRPPAPGIVIMPTKGARGQTQLALHPERVAGERVWLGATCRTRPSCTAVLFGLIRLNGGHLVQWSATAGADTVARARALARSVRPLGGTIPR